VRLELSPEQSLILATLDRLCAPFNHVSADHSEYVAYSQKLQQELLASSFLELASYEGHGTLDAALLVERVARLPYSAEAAASALVRTALGRDVTGPLALCEGIGRPTRFLAEASHVCMVHEAGFIFAEAENCDVRPVTSVIAYPLGELSKLPTSFIVLDDLVSKRVRTWWRVAIAAEAAGLMRSALDQTIAYVKERQQFGKPIGDFQAVQHRLAVCEQIVTASYLLAMRAAGSADPQHAALAALYVQQKMRTVIYDCHQFHGAMGLTLEYPLHLWTYRLKFLQGELGGPAAQAAAFADLAWPKPQHEVRLRSVVPDPVS
jgi:hypothetical protein